MVNEEAAKEDASDREKQFLDRVSARSLEEAEHMLREDRATLHEYRSLFETLNEIEGVDSLSKLLLKMNKERDDFVRERMGWQKIMKELEDTKVQLESDNAGLNKAAKEVQELSRLNATLMKENEELKERLDLQIVENESGMRNSDKVMGKSMGMLANTLPKLPLYSGEKEDWDEFETGFMIRYGGMEKKVSMCLLKAHLEGDAKDALRSVPEEEKEKGVKNVLEWLRRKLSDETVFEEIELEKKLRNQKVNGRTVGKVCEELEEWTMKLESNEILKEAKRRRQLLIVHQGKHEEHVRLLTLFGEGASYSKMKAALVELEYMRKTERESNGYFWSNDHGATCRSCGGYGHRAHECTSRSGEGDGPGRGASGHTQGRYSKRYTQRYREGCQGGYEDNGNGQEGQVGGDYGYGNGEECGVQEAQMGAEPRNGGAGYGGRAKRW